MGTMFVAQVWLEGLGSRWCFGDGTVLLRPRLFAVPTGFGWQVLLVIPAYRGFCCVIEAEMLERQNTTINNLECRFATSTH